MALPWLRAGLRIQQPQECCILRAVLLVSYLGSRSGRAASRCRAGTSRQQTEVIVGQICSPTGAAADATPGASA
eukprot:1986537-Alexandrium_andersonii.AAC.1